MGRSLKWRRLVVFMEAIIIIYSPVFTACRRQSDYRWTKSSRIGGYAEPQPDIALLRWRDDYYEPLILIPKMYCFFIEISDSTLRYDRDIKIPLYAKNGIPEVWLLDIQNRQLEIYREPINGVYQQRDCRRAGQIAPILCPDAVIDLAELFPNL